MCVIWNFLMLKYVLLLTFNSIKLKSCEDNYLYFLVISLKTSELNVDSL